MAPLQKTLHTRGVFPTPVIHHISSNTVTSEGCAVPQMNVLEAPVSDTYGCIPSPNDSAATSVALRPASVSPVPCHAKATNWSSHCIWFNYLRCSERSKVKSRKQVRPRLPANCTIGREEPIESFSDGQKHCIAWAQNFAGCRDVQGLKCKAIIIQKGL